MTKETKRLILQVIGNKNNQKRITIPKDCEISAGDYVEIKLVK